MTAQWYKGIPPVEAVSEHEAMHPRQDGIDWLEKTISVSYEESKNGKVAGDGRVFGNWIINHVRANIEPYVSIGRLKVAEGKVYMAIGFCQWISMETCRWKDDIECYPVTDNGLPEGSEPHTVSAAKKVIDAARYIRHWGDAYRDGSGMVVSSEHVRELWRTLETYDRTTKDK